MYFIFIRDNHTHIIEPFVPCSKIEPYRAHFFEQGTVHSRTDFSRPPRNSHKDEPTVNNHRTYYSLTIGKYSVLVRFYLVFSRNLGFIMDLVQYKNSSSYDVTDRKFRLQEINGVNFLHKTLYYLPIDGVTHERDKTHSREYYVPWTICME